MVAALQQMATAFVTVQGWSAACNSRFSLSKKSRPGPMQVLYVLSHQLCYVHCRCQWQVSHTSREGRGGDDLPPQHALRGSISRRVLLCFLSMHVHLGSCCCSSESYTLCFRIPTACPTPETAFGTHRRGGRIMTLRESAALARRKVSRFPGSAANRHVVS